MKKIFLLLVLTGAITLIKAQNNVNPYPKTITVSGSAELEVVPDQVYVKVVLREYQKRGENKKDIETLKSNFLSYCRAAGIADSAISIQSYTGYNSYYWLRKNKKKDPDLFASITYEVMFSSSKQMDDLIEKLDDEATQSFDITYTSHSKATEYRKQLKIAAIKAAKDKAIYLTEAINEKLGHAITVKEPMENMSDSRISGANQVSYNVSNVVSKYSGGYEKGIEIDFKTVRYRFQVDVIFALE